MAYTKRDDITHEEGETVVELDTGELVAASCIRKRISGGISYHAIARHVDEEGDPVMDLRGDAIESEFKLSVPVEKVDEHGDNPITREMLLAVLGEPVALFPWPDTTLDSASIRSSISAVDYTGPADAGAAL